VLNDKVMREEIRRQFRATYIVAFGGNQWSMIPAPLSNPNAFRLEVWPIKTILCRQKTGFNRLRIGISTTRKSASDLSPFFPSSALNGNRA
jgi:hypothetical protein